MKNKFALFLFLTLLISSCRDENGIDSRQLSVNGNLTIGQAKEWFESNFTTDASNSMQRVKAGDSSYLALKPLYNWDMAMLQNDSLWSVVELPWEYEDGAISLAMSEVKKQRRKQWR